MRYVRKIRETATGNPSAVFAEEVAFEEFAWIAQQVIAAADLTIIQKCGGPEELVWVVHRENTKYFLSWDIWFPEVTIIAVEAKDNESVVTISQSAAWPPKSSDDHTV